MELRQSWEGQLPYETHLLDGTTVIIRALVPEDEAALRDAFAQLSDETRYQRFHVPVADLPARYWQYLASPDGAGHVALVATLQDRIVGTGRLIQLQEPGTAEISFVIADDLQRCGVGSILRDELLRIARGRGLRRLYAYVLPSNVAIRRLLARELVADRGDTLELATHAD